MAKKFLVNIDLAKNQILNAAIQNLSSAPSSPVNGQIYYNTSDNRIYFWDGSSWIDMSGDIRAVLGGAGLSGNESNGVVTLDINVDNTTIAIVSDVLEIKDSAITTAKIANLSTNISSNNASTAIPTADAVKTYVDSVIGGLGNLEGGWDASSGAFPIASNGTKKGDYWFVTTAGTLGGNAFNVGDVVIAKLDDASFTTPSDWIQLEVNRDQASETTLGLVYVATQNAVDEGTNDTDAVTPLKLKTYLDSAVGGYTTLIGDNLSTVFSLNHGLNTTALIVAVYDVATGEEVMVDIAAPDSSVVTVSFATAPSTNAYRVVIKK